MQYSYPTLDYPHRSDFQQWYIGTVTSATAYGIVLFLFVACTYNFRKAILKPPQRQGVPLPDTDSNHLRKALFAFLVGMFLLSTFAVITAGFRARLFFMLRESSTAMLLHRFVEFSDAVSLVLANWCADASMMWRCVVVYSGTSQYAQTKLVFFLALLSVVSLGSGIAYIISAVRVINLFMMAFSFITATINIIVTVLIVVRLSRHQRYIRQTLGDRHGSPYSRLTHILAESTTLIVIFNVAHGVVAWTQKAHYVLILPHQLLIHIYVISALLVLYRAAQGRTATDTQDEVQIRFSRSLMSFDHTEEPEPNDGDEQRSS